MNTTPNEEPLSPEDEALAAQFAEQLEEVQGLGINIDEEAQLWLTMGEMAVPITEAQAKEFTEAVYTTALAKIVAQRPEPPKQPSGDVRAAGWVITAGFGALVALGVWALAKVVVGL